MPVQDSCQPAVIIALQKDGWTIINEQIYIPKPDFYVIIDVEAAKEDGRTFIEVKCFPTPNIGSEFYTALGQYLVYRRILASERPDHSLYLAVPDYVYSHFADTYLEILEENHVKIILVNLEAEIIVKWIR